MRRILYPILLSGFISLASQQALSQETDTDASEATIDAIAVQILMQSLANSIEGNLDAAGNESGELAKLVRALSGVSLTDIEKYGICGGENSELRKILGNDVCGDI